MTEEIKKYLHDLSNKISAISGYAELLQMEDGLSKKAKDRVMKINNVCIEIINGFRALENTKTRNNIWE